MVGSCYINVTGASVVDRSQFEAAIARLVVSHSLHGSESLCKLLRYLAKQAIDHPGAQVKEYQIATEVLGRQKDFDPQLDSMVRVQAGRLRAKLTEYYSTEGASDPYVVELPKGSYTVVFHERSKQAQSNGNAAEASGIASKVRESGGNQWLVPLLSAALLVALAAIGWLLLGHKGAAPVVAASANAAAVPYRTFWNGFATVPGRAVGDLQQCGVCGPARHGDAVLRCGEGRESADTGSLHGSGRSSGGAQPGPGVCDTAPIAARETREFVFAWTTRKTTT